VRYFSLLGSITLLTIYLVPPINQSECDEVSYKIFFSGSKNLKAATSTLLSCGEAYKFQNPVSAIVLYSVLYTAFLAASIPGCTTVLSILAGAMWNPIVAILLIVINSSFGGMCAYVLSQLVLKDTVVKRFPRLFNKLRKSIDSFGSNIWFAMIFLRVTPLVPNWFVSLGSPMVGMPINVFFFGGMLGFVPAGIFHCLNGRALKSLVTDSGVDPFTSFFTLFGLQFVVLLPLWLCGKKKSRELEAKISKEEKKKGD